ncbi:hypothetical protein KP509_13G072500 [Ceratopteris richardii]|uniref:Uncharacterized protein n=1 Tax=Ceratopteris richardii TaxID=49495 RepID=A0A8T2TIR9_CERRI|nr:hypothetical protein KP509_13G072500 [Ceratopteris richardii]
MDRELPKYLNFSSQTKGLKRERPLSSTEVLFVGGGVEGSLDAWIGKRVSCLSTLLESCMYAIIYSEGNAVCSLSGVPIREKCMLHFQKNHQQSEIICRSHT